MRDELGDRPIEVLHVALDDAVRRQTLGAHRFGHISTSIAMSKAPFA